MWHLTIDAEKVTHYSELCTLYPMSYVYCSINLLYFLGCIGVYDRFPWFVDPYSSGLLHWHWGNHDCLNASDVTLKDMGKIDPQQTTRKHNKMLTKCISLGMYGIWRHIVTEMWESSWCQLCHDWWLQSATSDDEVGITMTPFFVSMNCLASSDRCRWCKILLRAMIVGLMWLVNAYFVLFCWGMVLVNFYPYISTHSPLEMW